MREAFQFGVLSLQPDENETSDPTGAGDTFAAALITKTTMLDQYVTDHFPTVKVPCRLCPPNA